MRLQYATASVRVQKTLKMTRCMVRVRLSFFAGEGGEFFRQYFGPTQVAFARLDANGQAAFAVDLEKDWSRHNQRNDGTTLVPGEYLRWLPFAGE